MAFFVLKHSEAAWNGGREEGKEESRTVGSRSSSSNSQHDQHDQHAGDAQQPKLAIRRFDVFAEYNRLKGLEKGMDEPHAKGYGLWVAKVVASGGGRRIGRQHAEHAEHAEHAASTGRQEGAERQEAPASQEWHELGGEPQTDALFDHEIVQRMGPDFYAQVFAPAIAHAERQGRSYESIRDTLRKDWKPAR